MTQAEALVELVGSEASDEDLTAKVNEIHDTFHGLHEMMEGGEHEEGDHEGDDDDDE